MRYSTEPTFGKYIEGCQIFVICKKSMDTATKTGIDAAKTDSRRVVPKTTKAAGDLIGNKIADKITWLDKSKEKQKTKKVEEISIPAEKRQQIIDDFKLFWVRNVTV